MLNISCGVCTFTATQVWIQTAHYVTMCSHQGERVYLVRLANNCELILHYLYLKHNTKQRDLFLLSVRQSKISL